MARLLSVNVGLPRDVTWQGKTVHTAIWKAPVEGPRMVRRLNIDGDGQGDLAGHGGEHRAVFVYQIDSYRYWENQLGRKDFAYGQFGENFTVEGLSDAEVCIGDRYRIGGALFEVTQPRVTCYRVGIRMNEPQMAALLVDTADLASISVCWRKAKLKPAMRSCSRVRVRAHERVRDRCAALYARSSPQSTGARAAHPGAQRRLASFLRGAARQERAAARRQETPGSLQRPVRHRRGEGSARYGYRARRARAAT